MNKEQLKEAVGELNLVDTVFEADGVSHIDSAVSVTQVYDLIDQLDEPEKVVIPQFVADWIDAHDLHGNNPLREYRDLEIDFNEGWTNEKDAAVYHWMNENPYAFIDALRYGYEVEKEKLYYVLNKHGETLLVFMDGKVNVSGGYTLRDYNKGWYQLTEKQIKDYDERYWQFAEGVTE